MTIGVKRERVQFQRKVRTQRDDGGFDLSLTDLGTFWADVQPYSKISLETAQSGHLVGPQLYIIMVDSKAIAPLVDDVCIWTTKGNMPLNIREVKTVNTRTFDLALTAEFGVAEGG